MIFSDSAQLGYVILSEPRRFGYVSSVYRREVTMENVLFKNTQSVIKHCLIFAGRKKEAFREYYLSLYSRLVFEVLQGNLQPS